MSHLSNIAIIGAGGRVGGSFARELLKTGKHNVTAITRKDSNSDLPEGVKVVAVDYDSNEFTNSLKGQDVLIITLSVRAPPDLHGKIVRSAVAAGVKYIIPNVFGGDYTEKAYATESIFGDMSRKLIAEMDGAGATYITMSCGFWYEWSLALGINFFGIDIKNKEAVFFDEGTQKISVSTWDQCGRAIAALLSLPESGSSPSLADWKGKPLYINSFEVSQQDMVESVKRVTGESDWKITHEPSQSRWQTAFDLAQKGDRDGFGRAMYTRAFFPSGEGNHARKGLANEVLHLPKEDLDEATKRTVAMVESGWNPFA